jgi:hypothetical protein
MYDPYEEVYASNRTLALAPNRPPPRSSTHAVVHDVENESGTTWKILLTGFTIVLAIVVVVLGLIIQIFVMHVYHITPTAVYTTSPLGRTLAIAHVYSVVLGMSVPIAIGLGAYWLAGRWIAASYDHGKDRPTPYQYALFFRTPMG